MSEAKEIKLDVTTHREVKVVLIKFIRDNLLEDAVRKINGAKWSNDPNPYNCLPNYISAMGNDTITYPLCSTGNSNGCTFATGIKQLTFNNIQVAVYPNPTSDQFYIDANTTNKLTLDLFDVNGRHVFNANVNDKSNIDVTNLNGGIYTLTIKTVDGVINKKLVIVR